MTTPLHVFAPELGPELAQALDLGGFAWERAEIGGPHDVDAMSAAVIDGGDDLDQALSLCRDLKSQSNGSVSILLLVGGARLADLAAHADDFDDLCLTPFNPREFEARLHLLLARSGAVAAAPTELVAYDKLELNLETYQAAIDGRALDLTYMEYELLSCLARNPGKVFTRETLLSQVWGYDYYGGARTVDVHVRRLRSKLGDEHASLIQTVRSVGYRLGTSRWGQGT